MADFDPLKVLDTLPDALVATDAHQRIVYASQKIKDLLGWNPSELRGRKLLELIPPPLEEIDLGEPRVVRAARPDGSLVDVEMTLSGVRGEPLVATLREPSEGSADSSRRLRAILKAISIGVLLVEGPDERLTLINSAAHRIAGEPIRSQTYPEFVARYPLDRLDGRRFDLSDRPLARTMATGLPVRETLKHRRRDGQDMYLEVTTAPFPGGGAVTTFLDVTGRMGLEQELAQHAVQLRALIDHLPVGVAYFDKMAVCRAGNNPAKRFFGRPRREIQGATADELFAAAPALRDALHLCVSNHAPHTQRRVAWPDASKPGTMRYLDWEFAPLSPDPAKPRGALALITDVTEQTHSEAEKQTAMEAAESASRRKTQFLSAVSHDLRTPVNALSLQAELLSRILEIRDSDDDELQLLAGDIRAASNNLIELINDLLDLTRFDSGVVDYHPSDFLLDAWIASTLAPLELTARTRALEFSWDVDRPGRTIHGDRVKLGRVLTNLVGNAVKFTEAGEIGVSAFEDKDGRFRLEVRDTGSGIPPDQIERIFDEFSQLRNPERDRTKGTGLGLAICRRLVEGVGGRLMVRSEVGKGSTFTAVYPPDHLVEPVANRVDATAETREHVVRPPAPEGEILLVEDDERSRAALAKLLEHEGYAVRPAADGEQAIEAVRALRPALILLDLMLPGRDGVEVLRSLRSDPATRALRVVILTGDVMNTRNDELQTLEVDGILTKPVDLDTLRALLAELLPPGRAVAAPSG